MLLDLISIACIFTDYLKKKYLRAAKQAGAFCIRYGNI